MQLCPCSSKLVASLCKPLLWRNYGPFLLNASHDKWNHLPSVRLSVDDEDTGSRVNKDLPSKEQTVAIFQLCSTLPWRHNSVDSSGINTVAWWWHQHHADALWYDWISAIPSLAHPYWSSWEGNSVYLYPHYCYWTAYFLMPWPSVVTSKVPFEILRVGVRNWWLCWQYFEVPYIWE